MFALGGEHAPGDRGRRDPRAPAGPSAGRCDWGGQTVVCVASGPSLRPEDVDACRGRARVLVVNDNFRLAPWADALYACDFPWWKKHFDATEGLALERWTQDERAAARWPLNLIKSLAAPGLSRTPGVIHQGANSGYQAIGLAIQFGARRIILLGYDMQKTGGKAHWFGDHPVGLNNAQQVEAWVRNFDRLATDAAELGVEIVNCTRETALRCFPREPLDAALSR